MSLNWDATACDPIVLTEERAMRTQSLVWATVAVDMGSITEANIEQFAQRLAMVATIHGSIMQVVEDDRIVDVVVTVEMLRPYIGLKTNVTTTTEAAFNRRMAKGLREKAIRAVR